MCGVTKMVARHYALLSTALRRARATIEMQPANVREYLTVQADCDVLAIADLLETQDFRFDRARFLRDCGVKDTSR